MTDDGKSKYVPVPRAIWERIRRHIQVGSIAYTDKSLERVVPLVNVENYLKDIHKLNSHINQSIQNWGGEVPE